MFPLNVVAAAYIKPLTVVITPSSVAGSSNFPPVVTNPATATPDGGKAPYSYAWTKVTGSAPSQADSPSASSTTFSSTQLPGLINETWKCTVTDAVGFTAEDEVDVTFNRT